MEQLDQRGRKCTYTQFLLHSAKTLNVADWRGMISKVHVECYGRYEGELLLTAVNFRARIPHHKGTAPARCYNLFLTCCK